MNKSELNIVLQGSSMDTSQSRIPISPNNGNHSYIPVPKLACIANKQQDYRQQQPHNGIKRVGDHVMARGRISVAAQRASFEKLQDSVNTITGKPPINKSNNNNTHDELQQYEFAGVVLRSSISNNDKLSSPVRRTSCDNSKLNRSNSSLSSDGRWKSKWEESERIRKNLLQKSEAGTY